MADHYIDSSAAGGGDGSILYPWNSLTQLNAHSYSPGDYVYFKRGDLLRGKISIDFSGSSGSPVTFGAYGTGARPKISGAVEFTSSWSHDAVDPVNVYHQHGIQAEYSSSYGYEVFAVIFDGVAGRWRNGLTELNINGDWWWDEATNKLYIWCDQSPDYKYSSIEYSYTSGIFYTGWGDPRHYITFQNIHVYGANTGGNFFGMWSNNWTFDDVLVNNTPTIALQMYGCAYHTVQNCIITGIRVQPMEMRGVYYTGQHNALYTAHHNTFTGNMITDWTGYAIDHLGYSHHNAPAHDVSISYNDVSRSGTGIYIGFSDGNIEVHHNTCDNNVTGPYCIIGTREEYGLGVSGVSNAHFHHNTCTNGRVGCEVWNFEGEGDPQWYNYRHAYNLEFDHNLFSGNTEHGWMIYTGSTSNMTVHANVMRNNGWAGIYVVEDNMPGTGNVVSNNTVFNNNTRNSPYADLYQGSGLGGWKFSSNIYYDSSRLCLRAPYGSDATHQYNCYYQEQGNVASVGGTSYNQTSIKTLYEPTCINQNPQFVSTSTPDLHLQVTSPCIDAAEDLSQESDYEDNPIT